MLRRSGDERGVVLPLVAIFLVVIVAAATLGVDISNVVRKNSELQKLADIAALDSVRVLNGSSTVSPAAVCTAVINAVQGRNGFNAGQGCNGPALIIVLGSWGNTSGNGPNTFTPGGSPPNAVQATVASNIPYFFSVGSQTHSRSAIAFATSMADIEASSYGAAVASPLFCNPLAPFATGPCVTLLGPGGVAATTITFGGLLGTPTAISLGILTPNQLFTASVSSVIQMTADLFPAGSPSLALQGLAAAVGPLTASATLGSLVASGSTGTSSSGANISVQLGTLLYGALQLANGKSGINVSGLSLDAGVVTASVTGHVTQPPVIVADALVGSQPGATTSQITATITLTATGSPTPVTLAFAGASATANLVGIACTNPLSAGTDTLTGTASDLAVTGSAALGPVSFPVTTASPNPQTFVFYPDDPTNHAGQNPNPATMTTSVPDTGVAIITGLGPGLPPTVPAADVAAVLDGILSGLGFQLTGADIDSPQGGLDCSNSNLVQ